MAAADTFESDWESESEDWESEEEEEEVRLVRAAAPRLPGRWRCFDGRVALVPADAPDAKKYTRLFDAVAPFVLHKLPLLRDRLAAACVRRAWRAASHDPPLWRALVVPRMRAHLLMPAVFRAVLARAEGQLQRLDISYCTQLTADDLAPLAHLTRLTDVSVIGCTHLDGDALLRVLPRSVRLLRCDGVRVSHAVIDALTTRGAALDVDKCASCTLGGAEQLVCQAPACGRALCRHCARRMCTWEDATCCGDNPECAKAVRTAARSFGSCNAPGCGAALPQSSFEDAGACNFCHYVFGELCAERWVTALGPDGRGGSRTACHVCLSRGFTRCGVCRAGWTAQDARACSGCGIKPCGRCKERAWERAANQAYYARSRRDYVQPSDYCKVCGRDPVCIACAYVCWDCGALRCAACVRAERRDARFWPCCAAEREREQERVAAEEEAAAQQ